MKNLATVLIGLLIVVFLLAYMVTFQVPYHGAAVVTTFGSADEDSVYYGEEGSGRALGNLHLKWIWPIQTVTVYDTRIRMLETQLEQVQTADQQAVIPSLYVAWRIDDPLAFYTTLRDAGEAERQLETRLRDLKEVISQYEFDQLTSPDPQQLALADIEQEIERKLQAALNPTEQSPLDYGIAITDVGIRRLLLPADVTEAVFTTMRSTRQRIAQQARSEGESLAANIRAQAQSDRDRIMAFANLRADQIRAEAAAAAAAIYAGFKEDEDFASFMRKLESLRQMFRDKTTIVIDPETIPVDQMIRGNGGQAGNGAQ